MCVRIVNLMLGLSLFMSSIAAIFVTLVTTHNNNSINTMLNYQSNQCNCCICWLFCFAFYAKWYKTDNAKKNKNKKKNKPVFGGLPASVVNMERHLLSANNENGYKNEAIAEIQYYFGFIYIGVNVIILLRATYAAVKKKVETIFGSS